MIKVVYLVTKAKATGPINQAFYILSGLKKIHGIQACLVTISPEVKGSSTLQRFYDSDIEVIQLNRSTYDLWGSINDLKRIIREKHIDIIHSCGLRPNFIALFLKSHAKQVTTIRSAPDDIGEKAPIFLRPLFKYLYLHSIKKLDMPVACSYALQAIYKNQYGISVEAIQNGVDTDFYHPISSLSLKMSQRRELGLADNKLIYLVLGSLRDRKNTGMVINAFKSINNSKMQLIIVGDGPQEKELKELAESRESIKFVGSTKTPLRYLQVSDYLVSCSLAEGLPNTVLEGLSCGLPCILSDIEPHRELIADTNAGVLFDRFSQESLLHSLLDSIHWDLEARSLEARRLALSLHSIESLSMNYFNLYRKLLG